jgi:hypothetical protein
MLELRLHRRDRADRGRSLAALRAAQVERLEARVVLANGLVGVPGQFSPPLHLFNVTSIPQDPDNTGQVSTRNLTIVGNAENPAGGNFDSHGGITIEALQGATVIGSAALGTPNLVVDPGNAARANFQIPITLQSSGPAPQNVTFRVTVETYGSRNVVRRDQTSQPLTGTFVVTEAPVGPTVAELGPIATPRSEPVASVPVTFSEPIDLATFTTADLTLTRNGAAVPLGADVTFTSGDDTTVTVGGLAAYTTEQGDYVLTVNAAGITDKGGTAGTGSKAASFTVESADAPARIVNVAPITTPREEPVSAVGVTFSKPIDPATFTRADLVLTREGAPVPLGPDVTITTGDNQTFSINGLAPYTAAPGAYGLVINAAGVRDPQGNPGSGFVTVNFTVVPPVVDTGPRVVALQRIGVHNNPTMLVLAFDRTLDPARAVLRRNYQVYNAGRDGKLGTRDDVRVPLATGYYNSANRTVTLVMARPLNLFRTHRIVAVGRGATAITDTNGIPLDGAGDGRPGTNFTATFGREILSATGPLPALPAPSNPARSAGAGRYRSIRIPGP